MKLYRNWIINEVARAGEHTNERTYVRTYVLTYIRTGQTLYPLHNFVVRGDNNTLGYKCGVIDHISVNNAFFIEIILTFKAINYFGLSECSMVKGSSDKQNLI